MSLRIMDMLHIMVGMVRRKLGFFKPVFDPGLVPKPNAPQNDAKASVIATVIAADVKPKDVCWLIAEPGSQEEFEERAWKFTILQNKKWLAMLDNTNEESKPAWHSAAISKAHTSALVFCSLGTHEYEETFISEYIYNCRLLSREAEGKKNATYLECYAEISKID